MSNGAAVRQTKRTRKTGNPKMGHDDRNDLIESCLPFVDLVVLKLMRSMGLPQALYDDFRSAGMLGLVEAGDRFDPERGVDFKSFAYLRIRGAIIDHIRSGCELSGQAFRIFKAMEASHDLQCAHEANAPKLRKSDAGRLTHAIEYLSKSAVAYKLAAIQGAPRADDEISAESAETILIKKRETERIHAIVATLPEKERTIIEQYYFNDKRFVEVAEQYAGLSKSWVSRLHDRALAILRDKLLAESR